MKLNLGCSDAHLLPQQGWRNVDLVPPCDEVADLAQPWPWESGSVEEIRAMDIFEHIGNCRHVGPEICRACYGPDYGAMWLPEYRRGNCSGCRLCGCMPCCCQLRHESGRIHVMNEAHRVLVPGGRLTIECPDAARGAGQWQDPTHVTPWTPNGLQYFIDGTGAHGRFAKAYGITARFRLLSCTERRYEEMAGAVRCEVWKFTAILEAVK